MTTSSAAPGALFRYADVSQALNDQLLFEARRLEAALAQFARTCTEYRIGVDASLAESLAEHSRRAGVLDRRVWRVGEAFLRADVGTVTGGSWQTTVATPGRTPSAGAVIHDAARWLLGPESGAVGARIRSTLVAGVRAPHIVGQLGLAWALVPVGGFLWAAGNVLWGVAEAAAGWVLDAARWLGERLTDLGRLLGDAFKRAVGMLVAGVGFVLRVAGAATMAVAGAVSRAVSWVVHAAVTTLHATVSFAWDTVQRIYWNWVSLRLLIFVSAVDIAQRLLGSTAGAISLGLVYLSAPALGAWVPMLFGEIFFSLGSSSAFELITGGPGGPADLFDLVHQNFWDLSFQFTSPFILHALCGRLEALHARLLPDDTRVRPETSGAAEPMNSDGTLGVSLEQVFGVSVAGAGGPVMPTPNVIQQGDHSLISGYLGEQVSMAQVGAHEYVIGVNGLDVTNMGNSSNGLVSVINTAYFEPGQNAYYQEVRQRFLAYLHAVPEGSTLNFAGHSMGAGMLMLLLNDPAVQAELRNRGSQVNSVTTYGMVRPADRSRNDVPPDEAGADADGSLFGDTTVTHYVDPDDKLAMNVGGGHTGRDGVTFVDDGEVTDPVAAHTNYQDKEYGDDTLPFQVDPAHFKLFWRSGVPVQPVMEPGQPARGG